MMYSISICLSDLPKDKMKKPANGKVYMNLMVAERREPDQYGNDVTVFVSQTKEERDQQKPKSYVGQGKKIEFTESPTPEQVEASPVITPDEFDDLPF